jgi:hypothetical protein
VLLSETDISIIIVTKELVYPDETLIYQQSTNAYFPEGVFFETASELKVFFDSDINIMETEQNSIFNQDANSSEQLLDVEDQTNYINDFIAIEAQEFTAA